MNEEEKEAIEYLKRYSNTGLWYKQQHYEYIKIVIRLVEKLQKENEELKFEERSRIIGKYGDAEIHDVINRTLSNDYISVQKVKDKIEELQNGPLKINENNKYYYETEAYNKIIIQVLQELLEGRK